MKTATFFAFDLGAESGRCFLARYSSGTLSLEEMARFSNQPVTRKGGVHWDVETLWSNMRQALGEAAKHGFPHLDGIGVDAWGLDYALLDRDLKLLEDPFHYRDPRTDGMVEEVCNLVPRSEIYRQTGIQFMQINTLYQIFAASRTNPDLLRKARALLMIPDLFNFWLTGSLSCEYTCATTTQFFDLQKRQWAFDLLERLDIPTHFFIPVTDPGTSLGELHKDIRRGAGLQHAAVLLPAAHDTAAAVAAIPLTSSSAYISSGTWSLLGAELPAPVSTDEARQANFTNEGGVCGTIRLLKNIAGLWLLQCCRRQWEREGQPISYSELVDLAQDRQPFQLLFDPDDPSFLRPGNIIQAIEEYCCKTGQQAPKDRGILTRSILENLAFKYRYVLEGLERVTGCLFREVRIVGGGAQNRLLNQFTADALGRPVIAGPVEATVLGNVCVQMLAIQAVGSLQEARRVIDRSFPGEAYYPSDTDGWDSAYNQFKSLLN